MVCAFFLVLKIIKIKILKKYEVTISVSFKENQWLNPANKMELINRNLTFWIIFITSTMLVKNGYGLQGVPTWM